MGGLEEMMERLSDKAIEIINDLHTERLDYTSEYLPLIEAAQKLSAYEDTIPLERAQELVKAEKDGRLVVLPDAKYTDADGEEALRKAMWTCGTTNNPVTRYTADAIAEKLCREAKEETK